MSKFSELKSDMAFRKKSQFVEAHDEDEDEPSHFLDHNISDFHVRNIIAHVHHKHGSAVGEQAESALHGDNLHDQNPNALRRVADEMKKYANDARADGDSETHRHVSAAHDKLRKFAS